MELEKSINDFADAENIQNVGALARLVKQDGVTPFVKEVEEHGKKVQRGFLKVTSGDKEEEKSYKDVLDSQWKDFADALAVQKDKPKKISASPDPKAKGGPSDDDDEAKAAQSGQARVAHNAF